MAKRTITGTLFASVSDYADISVLNKGTQPEAIRQLHFSTHGFLGVTGYSKAGMATVTVELFDEKEMIEGKAESLRAEITKVRADAENAITQLTQKLNSLLAISNEAEPA